MSRVLDDAEPAALPAARRGRTGKRVSTLVLAALLVVGPALFALLATPLGHSFSFNMAWTTAFEAALADGAFYPRHLPALWYGLGGLDFFFYAPLAFFVAAGPARLICVDCSVSTVFALAGGFFWALAMFTFHRFARRFVGAGPALVGALIYGLLPYHLAVDWFIGQSIGEFAAYAFLPILASGIVTTLRRERLTLSFPLGFAGVLLCHLPTAFLASHVFAVIVAGWAIIHPRRALPALLRFAVSGLIGLAIAACFWLPALILLPDVLPEALRVPHVLAEHWLLFDGVFEPDRQLVMIIIVSIAGALAAAALACVAVRRGQRADVVLWTLLPIAVCALLMTAAARPFWESWAISIVQFPFRLMVFVDLSAALATAVLVGAVATARPRRQRRAMLAAAAGVVLVLVGNGWAIGPAFRAAGEGLAARNTDVKMLGALEYTPPEFGRPIFAELGARGLDPWSAYVVVEERLDDYRADAADADVTVAPRRWTLNLPDRASDARTVDLAVPYWRHLRATTEDGAQVPLSPVPTSGLLRLDVPADVRRVEVTLPFHWSEWVGMALSVLGLLALVAVALSGRRKRRATNTAS